jgi:hypothetical protein
MGNNDNGTRITYFRFHLAWYERDAISLEKSGLVRVAVLPGWEHLSFELTFLALIHL